MRDALENLESSSYSHLSSAYLQTQFKYSELCLSYLLEALQSTHLISIVF